MQTGTLSALGRESLARLFAFAGITIGTVRLDVSVRTGRCLTAARRTFYRRESPKSIVLRGRTSLTLGEGGAQRRVKVRNVAGIDSSVVAECQTLTRRRKMTPTFPRREGAICYLISNIAPDRISDPRHNPSDVVFLFDPIKRTLSDTSADLCATGEMTN